MIEDPCGYILRFPVTQHFGNPEWQSPMKVHTGTDYAMPTGTMVPAVRAGKVTAAWAHELPPSDPNWPQGLSCIVDAGDGERWWYAHFSRLDVRQGDYVERGQLLGLSGATGAATGPHLHLERNVHQDIPDGPVWPGNWRPVDPEEELDLASQDTLDAIRRIVKEEVALGASAVSGTITAGFNVTLPVELDRIARGFGADSPLDDGSRLKAGERIFPQVAR